MKDPWFAVNLSWTLGGLGQFYAGRRLAGLLFLAADLLFYLFVALFLLTPIVDTPVILLVWIVALVVRIVSSARAHRAIRAGAPPPDGGKNPWRAFFFARFLPGLGHAYAGKWVRAILFFGVCVAAGVADLPALSPAGFPVVEIGVGLLALLDAFFVLRKRNVVPWRTTGFAITIIAVLSQGFLISKLLQLTVVEIFKIPSSSMEPTLLGEWTREHSGCDFQAYHESPGADRILVSKLAYAFQPVKRFDVVCHRFPLNQSRFFIKRVVGLPDEELQIHAGDLYVRPKGEKRFRIARKDMRTQDALWIRPTGRADMLENAREFSWEASPRSGSFRREAGQLLTLIKDVRFVYEAADDDFRDVGDFHLAFVAELLDPSGEVFGEVTNAFGTFEAVARTGSPAGRRCARDGVGAL